MINLNEKLLDIQSNLGTEAFCVLLQIARHSNFGFNARPGVFKLSKLTGLSQRKVTQATNLLEKEGLISKKQLFVTQKMKDELKPKLDHKRVGAFFTNQYTITTNFISKFVNSKGAKGYDLTDDSNDSQFDDIVNDDIVNDDIVKSTNKVLKDKEVLKKEGGGEKICVADKSATPTPPILGKLLEALPEVRGLPHVRKIVEAVEDKPEDERMSYLEWVVMNKRQNPKLIEPKAWKDWFWLDYKAKDFKPAQAPPPPETDGYVTSPDGRRYRTQALDPADL